MSELGTGLSKRFKQLYDIIIADHAKEENKDMETIIRELSNRDQQNQGFFIQQFSALIDLRSEEHTSELQSP